MLQVANLDPQDSEGNTVFRKAGKTLVNTQLRGDNVQHGGGLFAVARSGRVELAWVWIRGPKVRG